jgi:hypothetical protein
MASSLHNHPRPDNTSGTLLMYTLVVIGGNRFERGIARKTTAWCIDRFGLQRTRRLHIEMTITDVLDCWGYCEYASPSQKRNFVIEILSAQTLRNFVMTIVHEMFHVKQYLTGEWVGDGEKEIEDLQAIYTDELWKGNIL